METVGNPLKNDKLQNTDVRGWKSGLITNKKADFIISYEKFFSKSAIGMSVNVRKFPEIF